MNREEILEILKESIVDSIGVNYEEIELQSQLVNDLGADSLDLVALIYQLETKLNISLQRGAIMERVRTVIPEDEFITEDGFVSDAGKETIKKELPELAHITFPEQMNFQSIVTYFTVEIFLNLIEKNFTTSNEA